MGWSYIVAKLHGYIGMRLQIVGRTLQVAQSDYGVPSLGGFELSR